MQPIGDVQPRRHEYTPKPRASDASEAEWGKIKHYFPAPDIGPRNRKTPVRTMLNATLFRLENNLSLRELQQVAPDFPPWGSVHSWENRVTQSGLWSTILSQMGRDHLLEKLPKMIHGARVQAPDNPMAKVDVSGIAES